MVVTPAKPGVTTHLPYCPEDSAMTMEELTAHFEIRQALFRYCRGIDRGDVALVDSAYHVGSVDRHGPWVGAGLDFGKHMVARMASLPAVGQHHITNILIELNGKSANVESYVLCLLPIGEAEGGGHVMLSGRYLDIFECREGQWKIVERIVVQDVTSRLPLEAWSRVAEYPLGRRGSEDPSATLFGTS